LLIEDRIAYPEPFDDLALMTRVADRDSDAFRMLVDRHANPARRIAYRMLGDPIEAEDVAQDAMLRLWRWLRRVTLNLCFDRLRRRRFASDDPVPECADPAQGADLAFDAARTRAIVVGCIGALGERQRAAIVLTYYEELSNIIAAEALEMNIKAFESLLLRARQSLRHQLQAAGIIEPIEERAS